MARRGTFSLTEVEGDQDEAKSGKESKSSIFDDNNSNDSSSRRASQRVRRNSNGLVDALMLRRASSSLSTAQVENLLSRAPSFRSGPQQILDDEEDGTMDIMMLLDIDKVPALREEFEEKQEGLTCSEFVYVMMKYLKRGALDETKLVSNLMELFAQIDVNGDGTMEWDEFTSFIVETGNQARENEPNSIARYFLKNWHDEGKHIGPIERAYYFKDLDRIGTCESGSSSLNLYFPDSLEFERHVQIRSGQVICAAHLTGRNQMALSSSNLSLNIVDDQSHRLVMEFPTETSQTSLEWAQSSNTLFSAGVNGIVHAWDVENGKEAYCMGGVLNNGSYHLMNESHTDMVLDLLQIGSLESLASASMDKTIKLWDIHTGKHKKTLEGHAKGVRSLAYSVDYRFIVSAGFDYDALVWNPYVEHLILRLHGHSAPLCKVEMIPDTPQIITADTTGIFKVWDIRNFSCVQTFAADTSEYVRDFVSAAPYKTLVGVGRRMYHFEYERLKNPELTDDLPVFCALYNSTTMTLLTASGQDIKLWDARKGTLMNRFRGICGDSELSALCLDDRERKFIVGDHAGRIRVYDYINGSLMKSFAYPDRSHKSEVSNLIYCNEYKIVISSGWDDTIMVHDEMDPEEGILLRKMSGGHLGADITSLAYSNNLSLIASGSPSTKAPIVLWDFEFGRIEAILNPDVESSSSSSLTSKFGFDGSQGHPRSLLGTNKQNDKAITLLLFLDKHFPGLVSADDSGSVIFWCVRPSLEWRNRSLVRFVNRSDNTNSAVSCVCADQDNYRLYTADDRGHIKVYYYKSLVDKVREKVGQYQFVECENPRRKIHLDVRKQQQQQEQQQMKKNHREDADGDMQGNNKGSSTSSSNTTNNNMTGSVFRAGNVVPLERSWVAHKDAIQSMQLVLDGPRPCLITASYDCLVRIFDLTGNVLGNLRQGESVSGLNWKFQIDAEARHNRQKQQALEILDDMDNIEQEFVRITALAKQNNDSNESFDEEKSALLEDAPSAGSQVMEPLSFASLPSSPRALDTRHVRKTPRLCPIDPKLAGRGFSNSLKGKKYRQRHYKK